MSEEQIDGKRGESLTFLALVWFCKHFFPPQMITVLFTVPRRSKKILADLERAWEVLCRPAALRPYSAHAERRPEALRPTLSRGLPFSGFTSCSVNILRQVFGLLKA